MNYFIHDERDLSPAYVRKCKEIYLEPPAQGAHKTQRRGQIIQAASAMKQTYSKGIKKKQEKITSI